MAKEKQIAVRVDREMEDQLKEQSTATDRTVAQVIRLAIREYLWSHPINKTIQKEVL